MGQKKSRFAAAAAVFAASCLASLAATTVPASAAGAPVRDLGVAKGVEALYSIACPTTSRCIAVGVGNSPDGGDGRTVVVSAATGASTVWAGNVAYPLLSVACAVATRCVGISENSAAQISPTTGAATVTHTFRVSGGPVVLSRLACAGSSSCYAVGWEGSPSSATAVVVHLSPTGQFLGQVIPDATAAAGIACPTSSHCLLGLVASSGESIEQLNSGALGAKTSLPGGLRVQAISCYQDKACYALVFQAGQSANDEVVAVSATTGKIGAPVAMKGFSGGAIDCVSASRCLVSGSEDGSAKLVTVTNGTPGAPVGYLGSSLSGAACASADLCYASGTEAAGGVIDRLAS